MTEPHAQADPTQPYRPRPGEGVEWPTAQIPTAQPPAYAQPEWPTAYGQAAPPARAYGEPYPQPPQGYGAQTNPYGYPQGQPQYPPNIVINNIVQTTAVAGVGGRTKSVGVAFLLTFLFGPLGMFYSTISGAIVMLLLSMVLVPATGGVAAVIAWPASIIWGCVAASRANSSVRVNQTSLR